MINFDIFIHFLLSCLYFWQYFVHKLLLISFLPLSSFRLFINVIFITSKNFILDLPKILLLFFLLFSWYEEGKYLVWKTFSKVIGAWEFFLFKFKWVSFLLLLFEKSHYSPKVIILEIFKCVNNMVIDLKFQWVSDSKCCVVIHCSI